MVGERSFPAAKITRLYPLTRENAPAHTPEHSQYGNEGLDDSSVSCTGEEEVLQQLQRKLNELQVQQQRIKQTLSVCRQLSPQFESVATKASDGTGRSATPNIVTEFVPRGVPTQSPHPQGQVEIKNSWSTRTQDIQRRDSETSTESQLELTRRKEARIRNALERVEESYRVERQALLHHHKDLDYSSLKSIDGRFNRTVSSLHRQLGTVQDLKRRAAFNQLESGDISLGENPEPRGLALPHHGFTTSPSRDPNKQKLVRRNNQGTRLCCSPPPARSSSECAAVDGYLEELTPRLCSRSSLTAPTYFKSSDDGSARTEERGRNRHSHISRQSTHPLLWREERQRLAASLAAERERRRANLIQLSKERRARLEIHLRRLKEREQRKLRLQSNEEIPKTRQGVVSACTPTERERRVSRGAASGRVAKLGVATQCGPSLQKQSPLEGQVPQTPTGAVRPKAGEEASASIVSALASTPPPSHKRRGSKQRGEFYLQELCDLQRFVDLTPTLSLAANASSLRLQEAAAVKLQRAWRQAFRRQKAKGLPCEESKTPRQSNLFDLACEPSAFGNSSEGRQRISNEEPPRKPSLRDSAFHPHQPAPLSKLQLGVSSPSVLKGDLVSKAVCPVDAPAGESALLAFVKKFKQRLEDPFENTASKSQAGDQSAPQVGAGASADVCRMQEVLRSRSEEAEACSSECLTGELSSSSFYPSPLNNSNGVSETASSLLRLHQVTRCAAASQRIGGLLLEVAETIEEKTRQAALKKKQNLLGGEEKTEEGVTSLSLESAAQRHCVSPSPRQELLSFVQSRESSPALNLLSSGASVGCRQNQRHLLDAEFFSTPRGQRDALTPRLRPQSPHQRPSVSSLSASCLNNASLQPSPHLPPSVTPRLCSSPEESPPVAPCAAAAASAFLTSPRIPLSPRVSAAAVPSSAEAAAAAVAAAVAMALNGDGADLSPRRNSETALPPLAAGALSPGRGGGGLASPLRRPRPARLSRTAAVAAAAAAAAAAAHPECFSARARGCGGEGGSAEAETEVQNLVSEVVRAVLRHLEEKQAAATHPQPSTTGGRLPGEKEEGKGEDREERREIKEPRESGSLRDSPAAAESLASSTTNQLTCDGGVFLSTENRGKSASREDSSAQRETAFVKEGSESSGSSKSSKSSKSSQISESSLLPPSRAAVNAGDAKTVASLQKTLSLRESHGGLASAEERRRSQSRSRSRSSSSSSSASASDLGSEQSAFQISSPKSQRESPQPGQDPSLPHPLRSVGVRFPPVPHFSAKQMDACDRQRGLDLGARSSDEEAFPLERLDSAARVEDKALTRPSEGLSDAEPPNAPPSISQGAAAAFDDVPQVFADHAKEQQQEQEEQEQSPEAVQEATPQKARCLSCFDKNPSPPPSERADEDYVADSRDSSPTPWVSGFCKASLPTTELGGALSEDTPFPSPLSRQTAAARAAVSAAEAQSDVLLRRRLESLVDIEEDDASSEQRFDLEGEALPTASAFASSETKSCATAEALLLAEGSASPEDPPLLAASEEAKRKGLPSEGSLAEATADFSAKTTEASEEVPPVCDGESEVATESMAPASAETTPAETSRLQGESEAPLSPERSDSDKEDCRPSEKSAEASLSEESLNTLPQALLPNAETETVAKGEEATSTEQPSKKFAQTPSEGPETEEPQQEEAKAAEERAAESVDADAVAMNLDFAGGPLRLENSPRDTSPLAAVRVAVSVMHRALRGQGGVLPPGKTANDARSVFVTSESFHPCKSFYDAVHNDVNAEHTAFPAASLLSVAATGCTDGGDWERKAEATSLKISRDFVEFVVDLMHEIVRAVTTEAGESLLKAIHAPDERGRHAGSATLKQKALRVARLLQSGFRKETAPALSPVDSGELFAEATKLTWGELLQRTYTAAATGFCSALFLPEELQTLEALPSKQFRNPKAACIPGEADLTNAAFELHLGPRRLQRLLNRLPVKTAFRILKKDSTPPAEKRGEKGGDREQEAGPLCDGEGVSQSASLADPEAAVVKLSPKKASASSFPLLPRAPVSAAQLEDARRGALAAPPLEECVPSDSELATSLSSDGEVSPLAKASLPYPCWAPPENGLVSQSLDASCVTSDDGEGPRELLMAIDARGWAEEEQASS